MRILFVNERCGYFGGVEQNIASAAAGLRKRGHSCGLAYGHEEGSEKDAYKNIFEFCIPSKEISGDPGAPALEEIVEKRRPDVIYFHKVPELRPFEPLFSRIRCVRMIHDHDVTCPRKHKYFFWNKRICPYKAGWRCWLDLAFLARKPGGKGIQRVNISAKLKDLKLHNRLAQIFAGSSYMRENLKLNGVDVRKIKILPPVIPASGVSAGPLTEQKRILYVGQLIAGKGVDLLLAALSRLKCDFEAVIIGKGNAEGKLKAMSAKLGLDTKVRFLGWVPNAELESFYRSARAAVVPSRWPEPFGMVGLEAMQYGRPVAAFAVGGIPDWLKHGINGLLAPEQDVRAFAENLERLLTDSDYAGLLGRNARAAFEAYSFEKYLDELETCLSGRPKESEFVK